MRGVTRLLAQSATKPVKPVNAQASKLPHLIFFFLFSEGLQSSLSECGMFSCAFFENYKPGMMTVTPQRHDKENSSSESAITKDENVEPLVAFGRPPPLPPVLGPLVAFSFFQMSSRDDDKK